MKFIKRAPTTLLILAIVVLGSIIWLIYSGSMKNTRSKRDFEGVAVEVEKVRVGSLTRTITAVGTLAANQSVAVRPQVHGLISKIYVKGGEEVKEGDPLFAIDDRTYKADLQQAEAKLALAKAEYDRVDKLAKSNFASAKTREKAVADLKVAEANVASAQTLLERTTVYAPFEGIVGLHQLSTGSPVNEQTDIFTLVDVDPIKVSFRIPGNYIRFISVHQSVSIKVDGFEKILQGTVEGIDSIVDETGHSIAVKASMPNKKGLLKPGLFARVDIVVGSKDNALIVPEQAIEISGDDQYIYKVVDGIAFRVPVVTGIREGENIEVVRGLNPEDIIITVGQIKIRDGVPVKYKMEETSSEEPTAKEENSTEAAEEKHADDATPVEEQPSDTAAKEDKGVEEKPAEALPPAPEENSSVKANDDKKSEETKVSENAVELEKKQEPEKNNEQSKAEKPKNDQPDSSSKKEESAPTILNKAS